MDEKTDGLLFKAIRIKAFSTWLSSSNGDPYSCRWRVEDFHINSFCSMADDWDQIQDLLMDERFDTHSLQTLAVGRFYFRVFYYCSDILDDLTELYRTVKPCTKVEARAALSNEKYNVGQFIAFVNNVVKHKFKSYHVCNSHMVFFYEDADNIEFDEPTLSLHTINDKNIFRKTNNCLIMPPLDYGIYCIRNANEVINKIFQNENQALHRVIEHQIKTLTPEKLPLQKREWKFLYESMNGSKKILK
jgi:hypothetical protein